MGSGTYLDGYRGGLRGQGYVAGYPQQGAATPPSNGLAAWFKADAGVTLSGGNATAWVDQIGGVSLAPYAAHVVPFNPASINGLPGLTFNGSSGLFTASTAIRIGSVPRYLIAVCKTGTLVGFPTPASFGGGPWFAAQLDSAGDVYTDNASRDQHSSFVAAPNTEYELEYGWDGNTSHLVTFSQNGTPETVVQGAGSGTSGGIGNKFTVGNITSVALPVASCGFVGDICEVLVYDHVLSAGDLATVRQYILGRYGIS